MRLFNIRIKNFKSINDSNFVYLSKTDLITILAGQNESGKTSLLKALKFFQEGDYEDIEEDLKLGKIPEVDCTFCLTEEEYSDLITATNKNIADYFKENGVEFYRGNQEEHNREEFDIYKLPEEIQKIIDEFDNSLKSEGEEAPCPKFNTFEYFNNIRPNMVFYSSFSDHILPGKIKYTEIIHNQAVKDFEKVYHVNFQELLEESNDQKIASEEERIRKEAAESLNRYWKQKISNEEVTYNFVISVKPDSNTENAHVNFFINQGDSEQLKISQKSQGFQWFAGFNLRLNAHRESLENKGLILLIDEPGQGLHETAQNDVKNILEELAEKYKIQIIYSTHQPILLGKENIDFSRLLLVERTKEEGTKFKKINQVVSSPSSSSIDTLSPVRSALGLVTFNSIETDKITIITEGICEYYYLKAYFGNDRYRIIPSTGVDQIPNLFSILWGWGQNLKVIIDDDSQGRRIYNKIKKAFYNNEECEDFKKIVMKLDGKNDIEEIISVETISTILNNLGSQWNDNYDKLDNIEKIGKFIFAKNFYDLFYSNVKKLDKETVTNFKEIEKFISNK